MGRIRLRAGWNESVIKFAGQTLDVPEAYPLDAGAIRKKACYRWQP